MKSEIDVIREKYLAMDEYGEEEVKVKIVKPLIELLGYKEEWQRFEFPTLKKGKQITDISIVKNGNLELIIEVKRGGNYKISLDDKHQLLSYMMAKNIEWGIITNGQMYHLINNKINAETKYREVLTVNLLDISMYNLFEYLSFKSIFETGKTNYFKLLAQFKVYFLQENEKFNSLAAYNLTISRYFMYLIENNEYYKDIKYLSLGDFKSFMNQDIEASKERRKVLKTKATVLNKYRHISKFYELFNKNKELSHNPFRFITEEEMLSGIKYVEYDDDQLVNDITIEMIERYFLLLNRGRKHISERNKIIFLLCLYAGLRRDDIRFLKISDLNFDERTIVVNGVKLPLHENLSNIIYEYINNYVNIDGKKVEYLFPNNRNKYISEPLTDTSISLVFMDTNKCENNSLKLTPTKVRNLIIRKLFDSNFSIDEIITITNTDMKIIAELISTEEIIERTTINILPEKHPFKNFFGKI